MHTHLSTLPSLAERHMASNRPSNKSRKNGSTSTVTTNDQDSNASQVVPIASSSPNNTRLSSSTPLHSRTLALDILKILTTPPKWRVPWHTLATAYAVPPDGIGLHISLVQLTDLLFIQSHSYAEAKKNRLNVVHENPEMDKVPKHVKNGTKGRGLFGTCCENPDCSYTAMSVSVSGERKSGQAEMKRCGGVSSSLILPTSSTKCERVCFVVRSGYILYGSSEFDLIFNSMHPC